MGFFSNIVSATVKTVLSPVAIVKDAVEVVTGGDSDNTKNLLNSASKDGEKALDDLFEGEA